MLFTQAQIFHDGHKIKEVKFHEQLFLYYIQVSKSKTFFDRKVDVVLMLTFRYNRNFNIRARDS